MIIDTSFSHMMKVKEVIQRKYIKTQ